MSLASFAGRAKPEADIIDSTDAQGAYLLISFSVSSENDPCIHYRDAEATLLGR